MHNRDHQKSEALASQASVLKVQDPAQARILYKSAADYERKAIARIPSDKVRTRGILAVSLVSLLYKAREFTSAEAAIFDFMSDEKLPAPARAEMRRLLEVVWDEKAIHEAGSQYSGDELLVSLRGGKVGFGTAPLDVVLHNIGGFNSLLYRVSEWQGNFDFRKRGLPPAEVLQAVQARVTQPSAGSYRFTVRLIEPRQLELPFGSPELPSAPPKIVPHQVSTSLLRVVELASTGSAEEIKRLVPDAQYRDAMLKLIRNIVPAGRSVEEVELTRLTGIEGAERAESVLLLPGVRMNVSRVIESSIAARSEQTITERGTLRALHLDKNWLEIAKEDGTHLRFQTEDDVLDDVVGPMVNRRVVVRGHRESRRYAVLHLDDIELDEQAAEN